MKLPTTYAQLERARAVRKSKMHFAVLVGKYKGKNVYRFPVKVVLNDSKSFEYQEVFVSILSTSAQDAANAVRDEYRLRPETEVYAYGPKGGTVYRYIGWESAVWNAMLETMPKSGKLFN